MRIEKIECDFCKKDVTTDHLHVERGPRFNTAQQTETDLPFLDRRPYHFCSALCLEEFISYDGPKV
jgi:hypothetical protein